MKLTRNKDGSPKIPKGWRKLRSAEILRRGDRFGSFRDEGDEVDDLWITTCSEGDKAKYLLFYIRRIKKGTK